MAEKKKAAKMENHSAEIVTQLLKKGKKNGGTLTYGDLMEALQTQDLSPDEIDDIRVTLDLDEGEVECKILTIFDVNEQDYIALMPLNPDGSDPDEGTVYLYRYAEDEDGIPQIDSITDDDEYEAAADRFDEMLDDDYFNALEDEE